MKLRKSTPPEVSEAVAPEPPKAEEPKPRSLLEAICSDIQASALSDELKAKAIAELQDKCKFNSATENTPLIGTRLVAIHLWSDLPSGYAFWNNINDQLYGQKAD